LFKGALADSALDDAERALLQWFARAEWGGQEPTLVEEILTAECLHVAVTGVRSAQGALGLLLSSLTALDVPVSRAVFARLRADGDRDATVRGMDPGARPQVEYDDSADWWRACFDPAAAPPLSEDRVELTHDDNALLEVGDTTYAERRGLPLHVPDVRICYGLADVLFEDEDSESRARDAARVLQVAVEQRFRAGEDASRRPAHYNRGLETDAALDRIRAGERTGYSCAFSASDLREFLHDHLFRYREYELMLALRDTVRALDLEPVVCWRRFKGRYIVQLWDRAGRRTEASIARGVPGFGGDARTGG
jgi:hypothetical protein